MGLIRMFAGTSKEVIRRIELFRAMFHERPLLKAETTLVLSPWMIISESKKSWEMIHNIANSKAIDSAQPMS